MSSLLQDILPHLISRAVLGFDRGRASFRLAASGQFSWSLQIREVLEG
jgi:hypothetical protein